MAGTDSHTCMAGALGCFAFGVGSTDMANAWFTRDVRVNVPETVRFVLNGELAALGVCQGRDAPPPEPRSLQERAGHRQGARVQRGRRFRLPLDERATLTNMAVEAGGFTGIIEADEVVVDYLVKMRGLAREDLRSARSCAPTRTPSTRRAYIDLSTIVPMVATPGDPRNGIPLSELEGGGRRQDRHRLRRLVHRRQEGRHGHVRRGARARPGAKSARRRGRAPLHPVRLAAHPPLRRGTGYIEIFERAGAELIDPSCGACIKAGPGVSEHAEQVTVSAINRNFPGRSGPGKVYLASPLVVAASAMAGKIVAWQA